MTGDRRYVVVDRCRGCLGENLIVRFEMDPMPLAGDFPRDREVALAAPQFPLTWAECAHCSLVQVLEDVDDRLLYENYLYGSSTVPGLVRHFTELAVELRTLGAAQPAIRLLEIGCNDGVLLNRLPPEWIRIGVDPSDIAGAAARENSFNLMNVPFDAASIDILQNGPKFDFITASNCLAHTSNIAEIIRGVSTLLADDGLFIVEVHDLDATLMGGQWDTIYHEHKVEWSEDALAFCCGLAGLVVCEVRRLGLHGGLLRAYIRHAATRNGEMIRRRDFSELVRKYRYRRESEVYRYLRANFDAGMRIAAYGAAGRANVWLNQMSELPFGTVYDGSAHRIGRYIAGVGTAILPETQFMDYPPHIAVITAWNHAADIMKKNESFKGEWRVAMDLD